MADVDTTVEIRTRGAVIAAKAVYYVTRPFTGASIASELASRVAWRLVKWRIGKGPWQRGFAEAT